MFIESLGRAGSLNDETFRTHLKREGRSKSAIERIVRLVGEFEHYLQVQPSPKELDVAERDDLIGFVEHIESDGKTKASTQLWALAHYFDYTKNDELRGLAARLREDRIERRPFRLADFRGVKPEHAEQLAALGIENIKQMLKAGKTAHDRETLSKESGISLKFVLELVKLSDLARIGGVKGIGARLYHDAGVDTVEKMAEQDPVELREMLLQWVDRTGFRGIAPLPKETEYTVATAKKLPRVVKYPT
jgi:hypothetical protein